MKKIGFAVMAVLVIGLLLMTYFLMKSPAPPAEVIVPESEPEGFVVNTVDENIVKIELTNAEGKFSFEKVDGVWMNVFFERVKTGGGAIWSIESIIKETIALEEIEKDVKDLEKYGFEDEGATVKYVTASGKEGFIKIGADVVGSKHYFTFNDKDVYTMDIMDSGRFLGGMSAFMDMSIAYLSESEIMRVSIANGEEEFVVEKKTPDDIGDERHDALFPYRLRVPVTENADHDKVRALFSQLSNIGAKSYDPYISDEEAGFTESDRFFAYETVSEKGAFALGNAKDGGYTYVKKVGTPGAYTVSDEQLSFMDFTSLDMVDKHIVLYYLDDISCIRIESMGESYELMIGESATFNEEAIDMEIVREFYGNLVSLSYDGRVRKEIENEDSEVKIIFYRNGKKDVTEYVPYDAMSYAVKRNGAMEFTIQKKYVEKILSLVKEL